jgi:hypothetical protein
VASLQPPSTIMEVDSIVVAGAPVHGVIPSIFVLKSGSVLQSGASFRDIVQRVSAPSSSSFLVQEAPSLVIPMGQDVDEEEEYYRSMSLVCRFNGFWPKLVDLNNWISATWIPIMQQQAFIHPCAKGFFIVEFDIQEDRDLIFNSGPWFWGNSGLFMKPWSPSFNPATDILSSTPVWVRLPNLPLHFWGFPSLEAIGSTLGKFHFASMKLRGTTPLLMPVFAWKWTSVKDSQLKLFLLVKITLGLRNLTMRESPCIADLVLKQVILHPIVPKGPKRSESIGNPLGGLDLMTTIK